MPAPDHTIDLQDKDASTVSAKPGETIAWHNSTSDDITLHPPTCVSPSTDTDIPAGNTSRNFTVNSGSQGSYAYTFDVGAELGTRNGTISVHN